MAITIQIKKSTASTSPTSLADGELAYTHGAGTQINNGKRLFIGDGSSQNVIGGQYFTDMLDHTLGTLTGSSAIITDTNSKVDTIKVRGADNSTPGNIVLDDNDSSHAVTLKSPATLSGNIDISLPDAAGTVITTGNKTDISGVIGALTALSVDNIRLGTADAQTITTSSGDLKLSATSNLTLNPTGNIDASNNRIIQVGTPQDVGDATNKGYVDGLVQGLDVKGSVRAATTANATLSTAYANGQTVGGVTVATGDRILIKDQSPASENGVYTVNASGAPTRATDFDGSANITSGAFVFVEEGTNGDQGFVLTTDGTITIGTTALAFTQFSGAGNISAGNGLTQSGTTLSVQLDGGAASGLAISSSGTKIAAGGVVAAMMANSSVDLAASANTVTGALPLANGGTGLTSIAQGSILVSNNGSSITALDGGASNTDDKILLYTGGGTDTLGFSSSLDGGTF